MARPRIKPRGALRGEAVVFVLTLAERAAVDRLARARGESRALLIREAVLKEVANHPAEVRRGEAQD